MKRILFFVGSRANYSSLEPIFKFLSRHECNIAPVICVGTSAVLEKYGDVRPQILSLSLQIDYQINCVVEGSDPLSMAKTSGLLMCELANVINHANVDAIFIVGDRYEMLAAANAASVMNIPIIHSMGGEVTGTIDELMRHAITKLSHLHLASCDDARERIIRLGEDPSTVFNVGCPRMDMVSEVVEFSRSHPGAFKKEFLSIFDGVGDLNFLKKNDGFMLASFHPVTTEFNEAKSDMKIVLEALNSINLPTILIWPNADAGSDQIASAIRQFVNHNQNNLILTKSLDTRLYTGLLCEAFCLVGNSSSGVREAGYIGTPVVNIGSRQNKRLRGENCLDVELDSAEIAAAIHVQLSHGKYLSNALYGNGQSVSKIIKLIENSNLTIQKTISY